ncbi:MAG: hypothetical protein ACI92I_000267 [Acidimicrobiales bacterium]|jgi:hypothetical protein
MEKFGLQGELMNNTECDAFIHMLSEHTNQEFVPELFEDTYQIETDAVTLDFVITDGIFEIRNIEAHEPRFGGRVLEAIHEFAEETDRMVTASNVKETAESFWREKGYTESEQGGEFFLAA